MSKHTPGPWSVGYRALNVQAPSEKGGTFPVCDIRGWGYLTGNGHGALGLSADEAVAIQKANARLIAAAPIMLEALVKYALPAFEERAIAFGIESEALIAIRAAIASAEVSP